MSVQQINTDLLEKKKQQLENHKNNIMDSLGQIKDEYMKLINNKVWTGSRSDAFIESLRAYWQGSDSGQGNGVIERIHLDFANMVTFISSAIDKTLDKDAKVAQDIGNEAGVSGISTTLGNDNSTTTKPSTTTPNTTVPQTSAPTTTQPQTTVPQTSAPTTTESKTIDPELAAKIDSDVGEGFCAEVERVAANINCDPNALLAMMYSESAFDPSCVNSKTGAIGIGQITPKNLVKMGYNPEKVKKMSAIEQLKLVEKYQISADFYNKGEYKDASELYSINFLPGRVQNEVLTFEGDPRDNYYEENSSFDTNKDGKITKTEMGNYADKKYAEMEDYYL